MAEYKTKDELLDAVDSGQIKPEDASNILRFKFNVSEQDLEKANFPKPDQSSYLIQHTNDILRGNNSGIGKIADMIAPQGGLPAIATGNIGEVPTVAESLKPLADLVKSGLKLPGKLNLRLADISEDLAEKVTRPGTKALDIAKGKEPTKGIQDEWYKLYNTITQAVKNTEKTAGNAVKQAKNKLFNNPEAKEEYLFNLYPDLSDSVNILENIAKDPQFTQNTLSKEVSGILSELKAGVSPERAQELMDMLDTGGINWSNLENPSVKDKFFGKQIQDSAIAGRRAINESLKKLSEKFTDGEYGSAKGVFKQLMDLFSKESNEALTGQNLKSSQAINRLRAINQPSQGGTRQAFDELGEKIGVPITNEADDILASEGLNKALERQPGIYSVWELPVVLAKDLAKSTAKNIQLPFEKGARTASKNISEILDQIPGLNKVKNAPANIGQGLSFNSILQGLVSNNDPETTDEGYYLTPEQQAFKKRINPDGSIPADQYRNRK